MKLRRRRFSSSALMAGALAAQLGCQGGTASSADVRNVDSAGVRITTITQEPASVPQWTLESPAHVLTGAQSGDSSAFALVGSVRWLNDGRIVVADMASSRLLVFDSTGAFLRALGRRGDGPGEFRNVGSVSVRDGDSLVTFDPSLRRLSVWHPDAGYVRSVALVGEAADESWPADAWLWRDSLVIVLQLSITPLDSVPPGGGVRRWPMRARLSLRDTTGHVIRTSPVFDGMYTGLLLNGDTRLPFSNQPFAAVSRDRVYFGSGARYALSYLDDGFVWKGELRWPQQQEALTSAEVDQVKSEARALLVGMPPERLENALASSFAPEVLPRQRPAIGRMIVESDGRLWVERFEATRLGSRLQKPGDRWTVLSPLGVPIARLELPPLARLEAVHGQRIAVVLRDSLDVQTVGLYTIKQR